MNIIQLEFADDLVLFCRGDVGLLYNEIVWLLQDSSQNVGKSSMHFGGVDIVTQQTVLDNLQFLSYSSECKKDIKDPVSIPNWQNDGQDYSLDF